ncbi:entericidin [Rhizobium sp. S152]|uniref:entericidin domain-containing protein n=1 Tax=Rhizobium sp. S152 TaxID=3055038 RepID=UPI0025A98414|nr:entericidin [Rhizobium sp. S152]MDM9627718.1 entericidin [Rhizobium sp. S152]
MKAISTIIAATILTISLTACGNTIRGMGKDTANTVDATQSAGHRVNRAASN